MIKKTIVFWPPKTAQLKTSAPLMIVPPVCWLSLIAAASCHGGEAHGEALFTGGEPLSARIVAHSELLPAGVVRCANCHEKASEGGPRPDASPTFGAALGPESLLKPKARRGGPPSSYDFERFCRLLREGVDPANVVIPQTMPRYLLSAADCQALWTYLSSP